MVREFCTHTHMHTQTHTHTHTQSHTHAHTHTQVHAHTRMCMRAHIQTHKVHKILLSGHPWPWTKVTIIKTGFKSTSSQMSITRPNLKEIVLWMSECKPTLKLLYISFSWILAKWDDRKWASPYSKANSMPNLDKIDSRIVKIIAAKAFPLSHPCGFEWRSRSFRQAPNFKG